MSVSATHTSGFNTGSDNQNKWLLFPLYSTCQHSPLKGGGSGDARGLGSNAARPGLGRGCRPQPGRATRPPGSQDKYLLCGPWTRSPGLLRKAAALAAALSLRSRRVSRPAASGRAGCAAQLPARPAFSRGACTSATATWPPGPSGPSGPSGAPGRRRVGRAAQSSRLPGRGRPGRLPPRASCAWGRGGRPHEDPEESVWKNFARMCRCPERAELGPTHGQARLTCRHPRRKPGPASRRPRRADGERGAGRDGVERGCPEGCSAAAQEEVQGFRPRTRLPPGLASPSFVLS